MASEVSLGSPDALPPEVNDAVEHAHVILVPTDAGTDRARAAARRAAVELARRAEAELVLFDRAATTYADTPHAHLLDREHAAKLGRTYLVEQIDEAAAAGVTAKAFAHSLPSDEALTDAIHDVGADLVVIPDHLEHPHLGDRFRRQGVIARTAKAARGVTVIVVGDREELHRVN